MQKQKYIQLFADALIPLLGFFFWHWNLYFIVLFYLIDALSALIFAHVEANKIQVTQKNGNKAWLVLGGISSLLFLFMLFLTHVIILKIHPSIQFKKELIAFWQYEDMGFAQGYILIPLLLFGGYQRYKMEFLIPNMAQRIQMQIHWKKQIYAYTFLLMGLLLTFGLLQVVVFTETIYVLALIIGLSLAGFLRLKFFN
ncbi:MAG: hypothetical protein KA521_00210 [Crocinitomicaceae bacterium]|nr:hypothetical protein [Crocinitomicaceae bacterium]